MKQGALVILLGTHFALRAEKVQDGLFQHPVRYFIDTNILIHAYDLDAGEKRDRARRALQDAWENGNGILSTQVLQEFYVNVTRKILQPLAPAEARGILGSYADWHVVANGFRPFSWLLKSKSVTGSRFGVQ